MSLSTLASVPDVRFEGFPPPEECRPPVRRVTRDGAGRDGGTGAGDDGPGRAAHEAAQNYRGFLRLLADRALGDDLKARVDASDVVQDTLMAVLLESERFEDLPQGEFKALLVRMMLNRLRSLGRLHRVSLKRTLRREVSFDRLEAEHGGSLELAAAGAPPGEPLEVKESIQRLMQSLARLPERERTALTWRVVDDLSFREMGRRLGCSAVAARKLWLRIVDRLRHELSDLEG